MLRWRPQAAGNHLHERELEMAKRARASGPPAGRPPAEIHVIDDIETARLVSDPLRVRLLGAFAASPRTTKQAADLLGEPPTKLYRHVEALERAGLLAFRGERQNRGTVEKYYQAVATRFEVDPRLFATGASSDNELTRTIREMLRATERELIGACTSDADEGQPVAVRLAGRATPERLDALRERLLAWVDECREETKDDREDEARGVEFAGFITLYRL